MALDFGKLNFSTSFNPTSGFPIDARTYFESYDNAANAAATAEAAGSSNTVYYFGQILTVYEGSAVSAYQITPSKTLVKLASTTSSGDLAGDVAELQGAVANIQANITSIINGATVVGKATSDAEGNDIVTTYATKAEVNVVSNAVTNAQANITAIEGNITSITANVGALQTTVGNAESGLVKDVNDLKGQIGGVTGALHFKGVVEELPVDLSTYNEGDVILVGNKEYVCNDEDGEKSWVELGDEGSYALKTTTINGKPLSANVTLTATDVGADPAGTASNAIAGITLSEVPIGANQTLSAISQTNGIVSVTPVAISIEQSLVKGLTDILGNMATSEAVANIEANVNALQTEVGTKVNATQVAGAIANATINASQINGTVANASYATQAGSLVNSITMNVHGTEYSFNGGEAVSINITTPVATNAVVGGILTGFTTAGSNYAVELDANNRAFVNVPVPEVAKYLGTNSVSVTANGSNYDVAVAANGILTGMIAANAVTSDKIASVSTDAFVQGAQELILNGGTASE